MRTKLTGKMSSLYIHTKFYLYKQLKMADADLNV